MAIPARSVGGLVDFESLRNQLPPLPTIIESYGIQLSPQGTRLFARCPWHEDGTPSFSVFSDRKRCGCPPCDWDGDVFEFVQRYEHLDNAAAAARVLCERYSIPLEAGTRKSTRPPVEPFVAEGSTAEPLKRKTKRGREIEHDDYIDAHSNLAYRVTRYELLYKDTGDLAHGKDFGQARPDGRGGWIHNMKDVQYVLYNLPKVLQADEVWLCEGERDARALAALGVVATTDAGGAGARNLFTKRGYPEQLRGKRVIICGDTDKVGRERDAIIATALHGTAAAVSMVALPEPYKDVREFLEAGETVEQLRQLAAEFTPQVEPKTDGRIEIGESGSDWRNLLLVNREHNPKPMLANVATALRYAPEWKGVLWYNEFSSAVFARKPFPGQANIADEVEWTDSNDARLVEWLNHNGLSVSTSLVAQTVQLVAEERKYHPVREYLQGLRWDSTPRIDNWLQDYCGVECSNYTSAIGSRWLISAIARIFQPGCKVDHVLVLEGDQGVGKSTTLRILGGRWFNDDLPDLGGKEPGIHIRGVWIVEMAELDSIAKSNISKVKAFITRSTDRYRPHYGRRPIDVPRQSVFSASVNPNASGSYAAFRDESGGRRFWPAKCGQFDLEALDADRDQLWAEAVVRYMDKQAWHLDSHSLIVEARAQQASRLEHDSWQDLIEPWLQKPTPRRDGEAWRGQTEVLAFDSDREAVRSIDILVHCLNKPPGNCTKGDMDRVAKILTVLGWTRRNVRNDDDTRTWKYRRK